MGSSSLLFFLIFLLDCVCQHGVCGLVDMWPPNSRVIPGFS